MAKFNTIDEGYVAAGFERAERHLFLCLGPDCAPMEEGQVTWDYLKRRAAEHGVSTEEEHRRILREILEPKERPKPKMSLKDYLMTMPNVGEDSDFEMPRNGKPRKVDLGD